GTLLNSDTVRLQKHTSCCVISSPLSREQHHHQKMPSLHQTVVIRPKLKPVIPITTALPPELLQIICGFLDLKSLCLARTTCRAFEAASWPAFGVSGCQGATHFLARTLEDLLLAFEEPIVPYVQHLCLSTGQLSQTFAPSPFWNQGRLAQALSKFHRLRKITTFSCQDVNQCGKPWPSRQRPYSSAYFSSAGQHMSGPCIQQPRITVTSLMLRALAFAKIPVNVSSLTMLGCNFPDPDSLPTALHHLAKFEIVVKENLEHSPPLKLARSIPALLERTPGLTHLRLKLPRLIWSACGESLEVDQAPLFALKFARLQSLSLAGIDAPSPGQLLEFLEAHSWLKELVLEDCFVEDQGYWDLYYCVYDHLRLERLKLVYSKIDEGLVRPPASTFPTALLAACVGKFVVDDANLLPNF
ncbi:hypothetical protein Tdes44962_MAKER04301, partial [Teratosphaeria destructans]